MWLLSLAQVLTVVATGTQLEVAAGASNSEPISTRQTYFAIPFEIDQIEHPVLGAKEIQLHVSRDRGITWQHENSVTPRTKYFLFRATGDGEYWFAVRTRDNAGNLRPSLVAAPGLRVIVDTQAPGLSIEAQRGQAGEIIAKWHIDEPNIQPESLKLQYRIGESQNWETVALDPSRIQADAATNSGEVTWWTPAGQGRIEIRAEVADAAGNRNVSHAQVRTVASPTPPRDALVGPTQSPTPGATPQAPWQASANQSNEALPRTIGAVAKNLTQSQQFPHAKKSNWQQPNQQAAVQQQAPQQQTYDPYKQGYGTDPSTAAQNAGPNTAYQPYTEQGYANRGNPSGYDPNTANSPSGSHGIDPGMTVRNQQQQNWQLPPPDHTQPVEQTPYEPYAQNRQPRQNGQQYDPFAEGYGQPNTQQAEQPSWSRNQTTQPNDQYNATGSVAAQPSPAYQHNYDSTPQTFKAYDQGRAGGYGQSQAPAPAGDSAAARTVASLLFDIDYTMPSQPMAVGRVELWGTTDGGRTWQSFGYDSDSRSPMRARVSEEGLYGFTVVFHPSYGRPGQAPRSGQTPDVLIRVDLTRPEIRLTSVDPSSDQLVIHWQASDARLAETPISLYYADAATGQWRSIARNQKNSGKYRWKLPRDVPARVQIRVEVADSAGNVAQAETRNAIQLARAGSPRGGSMPSPVQNQNARPATPSNQYGSYHY